MVLDFGNALRDNQIHNVLAVDIEVSAVGGVIRPRTHYPFIVACEPLLQRTGEHQTYYTEHRCPLSLFVFLHCFHILSYFLGHGDGIALVEGAVTHFLEALGECHVQLGAVVEREVANFLYRLGQFHRSQFFAHPKSMISDGLYTLGYGREGDFCQFSAAPEHTIRNLFQTGDSAQRGRGQGGEVPKGFFRQFVARIHYIFLQFDAGNYVFKRHPRQVFAFQ